MSTEELNHWFTASFNNHMRAHIEAHNKLAQTVVRANEKAAGAVKKLMAENVQLRKEISIINQRELRIQNAADVAEIVLNNAA